MTKRTGLFWDKVNKSEECWLWMATLTIHGYGRLTIKRKSKLAHRIAYELIKGPIPSRMCVLHNCDNRQCVNPSHLFLGTCKDNTKDMMQKQRNGWKSQPGSSNGSSKFVESEVWLIRRLAETREFSNILLAEMFNTNPNYIGLLKNRKIWKHID